VKKQIHLIAQFHNIRQNIDTGFRDPVSIRRKITRRSVMYILTFFLFLLPAFGIYGTFTLFPLVRLFILSFQDWDGISRYPKWIWLENYKSVFQSQDFWLALRHNLWWVLLALIPVVLGLALAIVLHQSKPRGRNIYRTIIFLPYTLAIVVVALMFQWMYQSKTGQLNTLLRLIGLESLTHNWLGDPNTALTSLAMAGAWGGYGFCMVLFLAGLSNIDPLLYDAAQVDGAGPWQKFLHITLPGLANTLNIVILIVFIYTMRVFDFVFITTQGGPIDSTQVLATIIYRETFKYYNVGYGSALSVITLLITLLASLIYITLRERGPK